VDVHGHAVTEPDDAERDMTILYLSLERLVAANPGMSPSTIRALVLEHNGPDLLREAIRDYQETTTVEESKEENRQEAITKRLIAMIVERTPGLREGAD